MKTRLFTVAAALAVTYASLPLASGTAAAAPVAYRAAIAMQEGVERVAGSKLSSVVLPSGALRPTGQADVDQFASTLNDFAAEAKGRVHSTEVLIWRKEDRPREQMPTALKSAGYDYTTRSTMNIEGMGKVVRFEAERREKKQRLLGYWMENGDAALLTWGVFVPEGSDVSETEPEVLPAKPAARETPPPILPRPLEKPRVEKKTVSQTGEKPLGTWSWTTISSVNYRDSVGRLSAPSGMSARFTFDRSGRYKFFYYIRQQTYSLVSEATTTEQGTVTFGKDGTFTLRPTRGHYNGHTGSRIINRDMTAAERKPKVWYWEWRSENGKRNLYIGPGRSSMSLFKRSE